MGYWTDRNHSALHSIHVFLTDNAHQNMSNYKKWPPSPWSRPVLFTEHLDTALNSTWQELWIRLNVDYKEDHTNRNGIHRNWNHWCMYNYKQCVILHSESASGNTLATGKINTKQWEIWNSNLETRWKTPLLTAPHKINCFMPKPPAEHVVGR